MVSSAFPISGIMNSRSLPDGVELSFGGVASIFWETADANANYWAYELPIGGSVDVPVALFGIGLDGVDLGLFDGVTQPTLGIMDLDRDTALVMDFSGDDGARIRTLGSGSGALTLDPTTDVLIANGKGLVVGHTAQIVGTGTPELQVLGTGAGDSSILIARFNSAGPGNTPRLQFVRSNSDTIGSQGIIVDNSIIGAIVWLPDDGTDFRTEAAIFQAEVDDADPGDGDIGMAFVWQQMAAGVALRETMRLDAAGRLTLAVNGLIFTVGSSITTSAGDLTLNPTDNVIMAAGTLILRESIDSAAVADEVSIGRYDIGATNTVLAISQETAVVTEVDETKFSHKMQVRLNGATYFLMLTAT